MPVWFRMLNLDRFATSCEMLAPRMLSSAADRFCTWLLMTVLADCNRLMLAPMVPRSAATLATAELISPSARAALAAVVRSWLRFWPLTLADESAPVVVAMALDEPPSLKKMGVVVAEKTDVPLKVGLPPMRSISALIDVNSAFRAVRWLLPTVPVEEWVARGT